MKSITKDYANRRAFLKKTGTLLAGVALISPGVRPVQAREKEEEQNAEVSPPEDLMREHGVLRRILLIYEDIQGRINSGREFPPQVLSAASDIVRKFIENYHEKLEEDYLFPRFEKAGKLVELVRVLKEQHHAGRTLTEKIRASASSGTVKGSDKRKELAETIHLFCRMYRPHAAREDTVLFPAFHSIVPAREFAALGEEFEDKEVALFGAGGFEKVVGHVADLEKPLGLYELAHFTPRE